jgi:hypothetical protein
MATAKKTAVEYTYDSGKGRYVTTDGLAFTTMEQAEAYCAEKNKTEKQ